MRGSSPWKQLLQQIGQILRHATGLLQPGVKGRTNALLSYPVAAQVEARTVLHQGAGSALAPGQGGGRCAQARRQQGLQARIPAQHGHALLQQIEVQTGVAAAELVAGQSGKQGVARIGAGLRVLQVLGEGLVQAGQGQLQVVPLQLGGLFARHTCTSLVWACCMQAASKASIKALGGRSTNSPQPGWSMPRKNKYSAPPTCCS
jgi:hypothetical protein